jgi:hypothetical protein
MVLLSVGNSCTPDILCWNITQSAGAYSTLAGVLAGFIVIAMIFSLEQSKKRHISISIPLYASSVACLSLALSSFLFAMLVGAELTTPASTSLAYILGSAAFGTFALSAIQLMLSIIWFFKVHEINSSIIYGIKVLIQFMIVVGILYMIKFSVDVLRVKSGNAQENPGIFLLLLGYALYAYVVTRISVCFIRNKWKSTPEEKKSEIARRLLHGFSFPGIQLDGLALIVLSSYTGLFIIGVTLVYGLLATDFINWLSNFNQINYSIYLYFTIFIYVMSPLFFILVQLSLPEEKSSDSLLTSDTHANREEETRE